MKGEYGGRPQLRSGILQEAGDGGRKEANFEMEGGSDDGDGEEAVVRSRRAEQAEYRPCPSMAEESKGRNFAAHFDAILRYANTLHFGVVSLDPSFGNGSHRRDDRNAAAPPPQEGNSWLLGLGQ